MPKHEGQESTLVCITRHLSNFYCIQYFKDRSFVEQERIQPHPLSRFADAKVGTFSHPPNFSNTFFEKNFDYPGKRLRISMGKMKVFSKKIGEILPSAAFDILIHFRTPYLHLF